MEPGLNGILKPSRGGRSLSMGILATKEDSCGLFGVLLLNGTPQPANFKSTTGYVIQDDNAMRTWVVRENLDFSAALWQVWAVRLKWTQQQNHSRTGHEHSGGVHGGKAAHLGWVWRGERGDQHGNGGDSRSSCPVLDEATTGLDVGESNAVLLLERMSRQGRTTVSSIHQPRYTVFKLFGNLILLDLGKVMSYGSAQEALAYLASAGNQCDSFNNPAESFLHAIRGDSSAVTTQ